MRILIADDDPISRRLLERILKKWGYELVICVNGLEALAELQNPNPPEIAILDWMMPVVDGPEVCRRLRESPDAVPTYIVLLTARDQRGDIVEGLHSGADDYVTKPYHQEELYARLQLGIRIRDLQRTLAKKVQELELALASQHAT